MTAFFNYGRRLVLAEAEVEKLRHELDSSKGMTFPWNVSNNMNIFPSTEISVLL